MDLANKKFVVFGLGKSGISVARWLAKNGADVIVSDKKMESELEIEYVNEIHNLGFNLETGGHKLKNISDIDAIIISPGIPLDIEPLKDPKSVGIPILGELEFASRFIKTPIVAVTGTNGKSTVTSFLGHMLEIANSKTFVGGNIGTPLIEYLLDKQNADYVVVEVSSFQLDTIDKFCPKISIILNISPDHLDRYSDFQAYIESKQRIYRNQNQNQYCLLNDDDVVLSHCLPNRGISVLRYGIEKKENRHSYVVDGKIVGCLGDKKTYEFDLSKFKLPGTHNQQNIMAGILTGLLLQIDHEIIQKSIDSFVGLPHRMEFVKTFKEIDFYNDSKATNVDSATKSIMSFDQPLILVAGGRHKGGDYTSLVKMAKNRVRKCILIGESRYLLADAFKSIVPFCFAEDMDDAVSKAFSYAQKKDVVLLAPACSSYDMFLNYEKRGIAFKKSIQRLANGSSKKEKFGYDYILLIPTLLLLGFGLVAIFSASSFVAEHKFGDSYYFLKRQGIFCLLGIAIMIIAKSLPSTLYPKLAYPSVIVSSILLLLLFIPGMGIKAGGAVRWLQVGVFSMQPSEVAKLSLTLFLAYSMAKKGHDMASFSKGFLPHLLVAGIFILLILLQPDLGTCVIIGLWLVILLFIGGANFFHILSLILLSIPAFLWLIYNADYRMKRWSAFLNPWEDPQGLGFQIIHSFMAIGSGGISGVGLGNSKQKLFYLPEPHTDFVLSIIAEELGFIGMFIVVSLFSIVIMRGIKIALNARDLYSSYLAMGISTLLGLQILINMGVVLGLLPTKGLTLPFLSYGGSSLLISLLAIGILLNISTKRS